MIPATSIKREDCYKPVTFDYKTVKLSEMCQGVHFWAPRFTEQELAARRVAKENHDFTQIFNAVFYGRKGR